jgi:hypothetical protein
LPLHQFAPHGVHGDAARGIVESRQQSPNLVLAALSENMQAPSTVFAAAPGEKNGLHSNDDERVDARSSDPFILLARAIKWGKQPID